jgi:3-oxoacyl-[acyl-carrier-protein] synthase II
MFAMDAFLVGGKYIKANDFNAPSFLPVDFYGYINWKEIVKDYKPIKPYKHYNKLPEVLKCTIKLIDELKIEELMVDRENLKVAIIVAGKIDRERDLLTIQTFDHPEKISPMDGFIITHNLINFLVASYLGIKYYYGLGIDHVCTSGLDLLGISRRIIEEGFDLVIILTINSLATPIRTGYHKNLQVVSKSGTIKPFDINRDGTIFADNITIALVVGNRLAKILKKDPLARIIGYKSISSSYHMFAMDESGYEIENVIKDLIVNIDKAEEIVIKAHATGTKMNDYVEGRVYERIFGKKTPITALKPEFGHTLTSSGLVETIYLLEVLKSGKIPPIKNTDTIDPNCGNIDLVLEEREFNGKYVISLSSAFGGFYSALLLEVIK